MMSSSLSSSSTSSFLPCDVAYDALKQTVRRYLHEHPSAFDPAATDTLRSLLAECINVHLQMLQFKSSNSRVFLATSGIKRKLVDVFSRERIRDKRFCSGFLLDKVKDLQASFSLHLYPTHFKIDNNDDVYSYDGFMKPLLEAVDQQKLLPELIDVFDQAGCTFYNGCLMVDIFDYRRIQTAAIRPNGLPNVIQTGASPSKTLASNSSSLVQPEFHRVLLQPHADTIFADLSLLTESIPDCTIDTLLEAESAILMATESTVCLDPSTFICRAANIIEYNKAKLRSKLQLNRIQPALTSKQSRLLPLSVDEYEALLNLKMEDEATPHHSRFKQMSIVDAWRNNKKFEDASSISSFIKGQSSSTISRQLIRQIKFLKKTPTGNEHIYSSLSIYLSPTDGKHEAILRWGDKPDTSVGGQTLSFCIGDTATTNMYLKTFLELYTIAEQHKITFDSDSNSQKGFQKSQLTSAQTSRSTTMASSVPVTQPPVQAVGKARASTTPSLTQGSPSSAAISSVGGISTANTKPVGSPQPSIFISDTGAISTTSSMNTTVANSQVKPNAVNTALLHQLLQQKARQSTSSNDASSVVTQAPVVPNAAKQSAPIDPAQILLNTLTAPAPTPTPPPQQPPQAAVLDAQSKAAANTAFLQRLIRTPYNQVPEQHRALYLQLKQKLVQQQQQQQLRATQMMSPLQQQQLLAAQARTNPAAAAALQQQQLQALLGQQPNFQNNLQLQQLIQQQQLLQRASGGNLTANPAGSLQQQQQIAKARQSHNAAASGINPISLTGSNAPISTAGLNQAALLEQLRGGNLNNLNLLRQLQQQQQQQQQQNRSSSQPPHQPPPS